MKKFILAATVAAVAAISMAAPSEAGSRKHGHKHHCGHKHSCGHGYKHGWGHKKKHFVIYYNDYDYYDGDYCYTKKIRKHGYWKKITICE